MDAKTRPFAPGQGEASSKPCTTSTASTAAVKPEEQAQEQQETAVRVALRARPMLRAEKVSRSRECLRFPSVANGAKPSVVLGRDRAFAFDHAFGPRSSQSEVYDSCIAPLVQQCFDGYNATCVCYGQTGSGKTFTMGSADASEALEDGEYGILPRVMADLFKGVEERKESAHARLKCAFLEIHNEEVRDLLHPETQSKSIAIRERRDGLIVVSGIREELAERYEDMMAALERGGLVRTTGQTQMNDQSSRSHAIFTIILEMKNSKSSKRRGQAPYVTSKFHLVDLAGSERNKKTGTQGARFKESVNINQGLLALGNVINALTDERRKVQHIPYRQSKLTRLLQDSLGGNSRTVMIACVPTADTHFDETLNTLKYASRARHIRNKPVVNTEPEDAQLAIGQEDENDDDDDNRAELRQAQNETQDTLDSVRAELQKAKQDKQGAEDEIVTLRAERDHANLKVDELSTAMSKMRDEVKACKAEGLISNDSVDRVLQHWRSHEAKADDEGNTQESMSLKRMLAQKMEELKQTQSNLDEAQSHLFRDEEIFAEKTREIEQLRKKAESVEREDQGRHAAITEGRQEEALNALKRASDQSAVNGTYSAMGDNEDETDDYVLQELEEIVAGQGDDGPASEESPGNHRTFGERDEQGEEIRSVKSIVNHVRNLKNKVSIDDAEARKLQREGEHVEKEKEQLEQELTQRNRDYEREKRHLQTQLTEMDQNVKEQERLIQDKERNEAELRKQTSEYEQRLAELEKQVNNKESEVEFLQDQLKSLEESAQQSAEEKQRLRQEYENKLKGVKSEISKLKSEHNKEQNKRNERLRIKSESQVSELRSELERMRSDQQNLQRKLQEQEDKQRQARQQLKDQVAQKKQIAENEKRRVKELEEENRSQKKDLEEKKDKLHSAHRRLQQLGKSPEKTPHSGKGGGAREEPLSSTGRRSTTRIPTRPRTAPKRSSQQHQESEVSDEEIRRQCTWIDDNLEALLREKEVKGELEKVISKQTSLQADKESQNNERLKLQGKRERMQKHYEHVKKEMEQKLHSIENSLREAEANVRSGDVKKEEETAHLRKRKEEIEQNKNEAEDRLKEENLLPGQDEAALRDIEENLDGLEAECEYIAGEVAERQRELKESSSAASSVRERLKQLPGTVAKAALASYLDKAAQWRYDERKEQERVCELETQLAEQSKRAAELENSLKMKEIEYDRRVVDLRKESERRVQMMLSGSGRVEEATSVGEGTWESPSASSRQGSRRANKELQRKVRQLSEDLNHVSEGSVTSNQQRSYVRPQSSPGSASASRRIDVASSSASPKQGSDATWQNANAADDDSTGVGSAMVKVPRERLKQVGEKQVAKRASAAGLQVPQQLGGEAGAAPQTPPARRGNGADG